jgi:hypothetical protein
LPDHLLALLRRQGDVATRAQLVASGLADSQIARLVRSEVLHHVERSIYLLGCREPSWRQYAWGGVLLGGHRARLMSRSAGAVEGLCGEILPVVVAVPAAAGLRSRSWVRFVREEPGVRSSSSVGRPARTTVEDTVLGLCAQATTPAAVVGVLTTASQRLTSHRKLARALERRQRITNRRLIEEVIADVRDGARSPLEVRWIRDVERPHRLPAPLRPYRLATGEVADGAYEAYGVLLELDGQAYHRGEQQFRDWRRDNGHSEEGWLTVRYGWHDTVGSPCAVAHNLARILSHRGWPDTAHPCRRWPPELRA